MDRHGKKIAYEANLNRLPNGSFVQIEGAAFLVWNDALLLWTPERYARKDRRPGSLMAAVLTPQPIVQCFVQGYEPGIHSSAHAL